MKNTALILSAFLLFTASCKSPTPPSGPANNENAVGASPTRTPTPIPDGAGGAAKQGHAYRISGNIDEAKQEGNVCDTSVKFEVPGTLKFEFTPESPTKGKYTYSGPFNATGSGPYEIHDDGTMVVDGTGCIMGKCATYSHKWQAKPIDAATCVAGK
jgi:hypothetical protein